MSTSASTKHPHVDTAQRGRVPGIVCGQLFYNRATVGRLLLPKISVTLGNNKMQAAMYGVHTQPMCGIMSGMEHGGCMAIAVRFGLTEALASRSISSCSGGYDNDVDEGDTLTYTGAGGKDLSGNKRQTKGQQNDQNFGIVRAHSFLPH